MPVRANPSSAEQASRREDKEAIKMRNSGLWVPRDYAQNTEKSRQVGYPIAALSGSVTPFPGRYRGRLALLRPSQRWQVMATYSPQAPAAQFAPTFGTDPVISSGSTRRNEEACAKSRDWQ